MIKGWDTTINLRDIHGAHKAGEMTIQQVARILADRVRQNKYYKEIEDNFDLWTLAEELQDLSNDMELEKTEAVAAYDEILAMLYDFGDEGKKIWFVP